MSAVCSCLCLSWTVLWTLAFHLLRSAWRLKHRGSSSNYWQRLTIVVLSPSKQEAAASLKRRNTGCWSFECLRGTVHCCTTKPHPCFYETLHSLWLLWQFNRVREVADLRPESLLYIYLWIPVSVVTSANLICDSGCVRYCSNNSSKDILCPCLHSHTVKTVAVWPACILFESPSHLG